MSAVQVNEKSVFNIARRIDSREARAEYLRQICGDNPKALGRVVELLEVHEQEQSFLESPAVAHGPLPAVETIDQPSERVGTLIGPYKLLEQIGEGGMGLVYMAEQQRPMRRLVALKLIKPGMDSRQVIARFEAEKQALAMMDHQNIAKVFEAGTTDTGRSYFAMELVRGIPINEFCDQKRLTVRQRLELFIQVCQAVQHAHQKGIIHRDLKPTNVLVTLHDTVAVPKVIDFGIAKALGHQLTEHSLHTGFAQLVGTPLYMSPEQAEMNQLGVDTRSDVYSLGVLLYELLTGTTPFDKETLSKAGLDEMRRMIREDEPSRPSARVSTLQAQALSTISQRRSTDPRRISATLRGELDWIVMRALEKDRSRRYESASAFATDIQRYLSDEPVHACPPTTMYRFQKFARKHKPALAIAAVTALSLILGTTVSAWQAARATTAEAQANANEQKANTQRDEAQRQRDEVKILADKLAAKEHQLLRTLYAANMKLAKNALEDAAVHQARELLEQHRPKPGEPDLRGFEWHYLYRVCHAELLTFKGHGGWVSSAAFSPDGKRLASTGGNFTAAGLVVTPTVKVWDAQTGQELFTVNGGGLSVVFSPDGKRLACGSRGDTVMVCDAQTGQKLLTINGGASSVVFSPDGKHLAGASRDNTVKVWDAETGQEIRSINGGVRAVAFSPDGKRLACPSEDKSIKVWDVQKGKELLAIKGVGSADSVAFSPDGKRLLSDASNQTVKVWDANTGEEILSRKRHTGDVRSVAYSPDSKRLASASADRTVKVWDGQTGEELFTFQGHANIVTCVVFSPDGTRLVSTSTDGTVKVWDATTSPGARTFRGLINSVRGVAFSPDGKRLASSAANWDDAKQAYVNRELKVWDARTGQELIRIKVDDSAGGRVAFSAGGRVAFSPDGKRLAGAWDDKTLTVWDSQTGQELLTFKAHTEGVYNVAFSPDGKRLATSGSGAWDVTKRGYAAGEVKLWDAQTGQELLVLKGHSSSINDLAYSPDGKRLATHSRDSTVKVWDAQTGQEILSMKASTPPQGRGSLAFSPDGKRLASSCQATSSNIGPGALGEVKVWDAQTGQELFTLKGHTATVTSVAFSADGKRLASGSGSAVGQNGEVKVWDPQTGQELLTLKGGNFFHRVAFSPDGHWLTSLYDGSLKIYDATPLPEKP